MQLKFTFFFPHLFFIKTQWSTREYNENQKTGPRNRRIGQDRKPYKNDYIKIYQSTYTFLALLLIGLVPFPFFEGTSIIGQTTSFIVFDFSGWQNIYQLNDGTCPLTLLKGGYPGVTPLYGIYRCVQLQRVRFSAVLVINSE